MPSCSCAIPAHSITKPDFTGVASQHKVGSKESATPKQQSCHLLSLFPCTILVGESMVCKSVFFGVDLSLALDGVLR